MKDKRILLYTGKGGVGKTTIAAATACRCAELGYKTLVISIDPAHSLGDVFKSRLGPEPQFVGTNKNLFAQEVDVYYSINKYWGNLKEYIKAIFKWRGIDDILSEELSILPGMEEIAGFLWVEFFYEEEDYDVIILDSAPTGETLRFLSLPDVAEWWFRKILPIQKRIVQTLRPAVKVISDFPLPENRTYDAAEELFDKLYSLHSMLQNPNVSSIRLTINPELMVLRESQRAFTYLHLFGYPVDAVILNRVSEDIQFQKKYIKQIEDYFQPLPVFKVSHYSKEVLGVKRLIQLSKELYGNKNPLSVFYRDVPFKFEKKGQDYVITVSLPFTTKEDVNLIQNGEELIISLNTFRRHIYLPRGLSNYEATEAKLEGNSLYVFLKKEKGEE